MNSTYTQKLSEYIESLSYEDIPEEVITQVKRLTLHTIGVAIASDGIDQSKQVKRFVQDKGGAPQATVWGGTGKVPVQDAAFANATQADILDWEDCSWTGHPSAGAVSAAFSVAEETGASGKEYIEAVVAAYEGYQRIANAVQPSRSYQKAHGWGLTSWQIFASQIAAAKLYKLGADKINQSFGAAVYAANNPLSLHSLGKQKSDVYHLAHGTAALNGVNAAKFAQFGFGNGKDYLDGEKGYWQAVSDQVDESWYLKDLNAHWLILETYIKHWPANMWVQTPLELLDSIVKENNVETSHLSEITFAPKTTISTLNYAETERTTLDAQFNTPFCFAAYLLNHTPGPEWFAEDQLSRPEILELSAKISSYGEVKYPRDHFEVFSGGSFPEQTVNLILDDGTKLSKTGRFPKGHPQNNTTLAEEIELFLRITEPVIGKNKAEKFVVLVNHLENLENVLDAAAQLTAGGEV